MITLSASAFIVNTLLTFLKLKKLDNLEMEKIKCLCLCVFNSDLILNCELVRNIHEYLAQLEFPFYFKSFNIQNLF